MTSITGQIISQLVGTVTRLSKLHPLLVKEFLITNLLLRNPLHTRWCSTPRPTFEEESLLTINKGVPTWWSWHGLFRVCYSKNTVTKSPWFLSLTTWSRISSSTREDTSLVFVSSVVLPKTGGFVVVVALCHRPKSTSAEEGEVHWSKGLKRWTGSGGG